MLQAAVLLSVPLIFGSMAGLLCEKSGVINIAIEGQLLFAAFISAVVASLSQNLIWGLISAPIAGAAVSWILAYFSIKFQVDQVILGFVINVLILGLTNFFIRYYSFLMKAIGMQLEVFQQFKFQFYLRFPLLDQFCLIKQ